MIRPRSAISEMREDDLSFLIDLWHNPQVMRYADEFPRLRGWSRADDPQTAWQTHQHMRAVHGTGYTQLILRLVGGLPIGESFFALLPEGFAFGRWCKPEGIATMMGDIKLLPEYWAQGLGTEGMRHVVQHLFTQTPCQLLIAPPHRHNPAAYRVYEKAGFVRFRGMRSHRNHRIMELTRERFREIYAGVLPFYAPT
jgi:RimJ/RimL family protein N-acetyltransferase